LLDIPRIGKHALFGIAPGQATVMHHDHWSIVGLNKDQEQVPAPSFEPVEKNIQAVKDALLRLIPGADLSHCRGRTCLKVDMDQGATGFANLNVAFGEPAPGYFWVLPGKMSEAPFAADAVVEAVSGRLGRHGLHAAYGHGEPSLAPGGGLTVASRPVDGYVTGTPQ
jgi:hypothetical protein